MATSSQHKLGLTSKILIGMVTGIAIGLFLRNYFPDSAFIKDYITNGFLHVIGTIFISSLKMLVVPLVFISLVCGTCSLSEPSKLAALKYQIYNENNCDRLFSNSQLNRRHQSRFDFLKSKL